MQMARWRPDASAPPADQGGGGAGVLSQLPGQAQAGGGEN